LSQDIVRIKIFNTQGVIIYSDEENLIGEKFSNDDLNRALNNESVAEIERDLAKKEEHLYEQGYKGGIYIPIFLEEEEILGVVEVYFILDRLDANIRKAKTDIWIGLIVDMAALYFALFFIVKKASTTLIEQDIQLRAEKKKLEEKDMIKSDFISVASHELRTPLSKIQGYIEYLTYKRYVKKEGAQKIQVVRGSINRLNSIVDDLLKLSSMEKPFMRKLETCCLIEIVMEVADFMEQYIAIRKHTLRLELGEDLVLKGYRSELYDIYYHLIINAIKYTPDGGEIEVGGEERENDYLFYVKDNGIGIPKEEWELIFDPFYEVKDVMSHHTGSFGFMDSGLGSGLAICRKFVELHRGRIWVSSEVGKGSTFYFTLPKSSCDLLIRKIYKLFLPLVLCNGGKKL